MFLRLHHLLATGYYHTQGRIDFQDWGGSPHTGCKTCFPYSSCSFLLSMYIPLCRSQLLHQNVHRWQLLQGWGGWFDYLQNAHQDRVAGAFKAVCANSRWSWSISPARVFSCASKLSIRACI